MVHIYEGKFITLITKFNKTESSSFIESVSEVDEMPFCKLISVRGIL